MTNRLDPAYIALADQTLAAISDAVSALNKEMQALERYGEYNEWFYARGDWSLFVPEWLLWRWWLIRNEGGRADPGLAHWYRQFRKVATQQEP